MNNELLTEISFYHFENNQFDKCGEGADKNIGKTGQQKRTKIQTEEMKYSYFEK